MLNETLRNSNISDPRMRKSADSHGNKHKDSNHEGKSAIKLRGITKKSIQRLYRTWRVFRSVAIENQKLLLIEPYTFPAKILGDSNHGISHL